MTTTPLSVITNAALGGNLTDLHVRARQNMPSILKDGDKTIAIIKDEAYSNLLSSAAVLRSQLDLAVLILDNLPGISIDTKEMHRVLNESRMEEM